MVNIQSLLVQLSSIILISTKALEVSPTIQRSSSRPNPSSSDPATVPCIPVLQQALDHEDQDRGSYSRVDQEI